MLDTLYHSLSPIAFRLGSLEVRWYGLAYLVGFIAAAYIISATAKRWRIPLTGDEILQLIIGVGFGVILGGRIGYVLFYGAGYFSAHPSAIFAIAQGGMSFHGGLVGAVIGGALACKVARLDPRTMIDLGCIAAPVGLFFGRLANFVNGELWGKVTDVAWAVTFESGGGLPRHPSQLYEALLEGLVLFVVMFCLARRVPPRPQGTFLGIFLILYGIFRFVVEFVRVPDAQLGYLWDVITMGQLLSLPLIFVGAAELYLAYKRYWPQRGSLDQIEYDTEL